jgi:hypothetical protein
MAVSTYPGALEFMPIELQSDIDVVMTAVSQNGNSLRCVPMPHRGNREVVLTAVSQDGRALAYVSEDLQSDYEIVMAAVSQNGSALIEAPDFLRADREVVLAAVRSCGEAISDALCPLDSEIIGEALSRAGCALRHLSIRERSNKKMVTVAVANTHYALVHASPDLREGGLRVYIDRQITKHKISQLVQAKLIFLLAARPVENNQIALSKLNCHGPHFASLFKKAIFEYVDIPFHKTLMAAFKNLS